MAQDTFGSGGNLDAARARVKKWIGVSGALALATVLSLVFGLQPAVKDYKAIKERLKIEKIDGKTGAVTTVAVIEDRHERGSAKFAQLAALAPALQPAQLPRALAWIAQYLAPSRAHALIPNAAETSLRDCFIATSCTPVQNFKFHGVGTGATAAAEGDTACQTELTTQYNPDNTRATGSQTNNGANVYRTVGTNTVDATVAITEFCLMSQAATGGGTMWSRSTFSAINLSASDSLQTTYDLTIE